MYIYFIETNNTNQNHYTMKMKINDTVVTKHGKGKIVKFEHFRTVSRVGVKLNKIPDEFKNFNTPLFYFYSEIIEINGKKVNLNDVCHECKKNDAFRFDGYRNICSRCEIDL